MFKFEYAAIAVSYASEVDIKVPCLDLSMQPLQVATSRRYQSAMFRFEYAAIQLDTHSTPQYFLLHSS